MPLPNFLTIGQTVWAGYNGSPNKFDKDGDGYAYRRILAGLFFGKIFCILTGPFIVKA